MASNSLCAHLLAYLHILHKSCYHSKKCISCSHTSSIQLLPAITAKRYSTTPNQRFLSTADDMENNKVSKGSSATNDNSPDTDSPTSEAYIHMPPKPMGTRPCSPSESDISVYALPPPAYHVSSDVLLATPLPTIIPAVIEMLPAQGISPAIASTAIIAPAPAVIASTPAAVQSSSLGTPAQPTPATTRKQSDVESTTYGCGR